MRINPKTMTGTIAYMPISPSTSEDVRTNNTICPRNARTMTKILAQAVMTSASFHILRLRGSIILTNIKLIHASNSQAKRRIAKRVNCVHLFTTSSNIERFLDVTSCFCMTDYFLRKLLCYRNGKRIHIWSVHCHRLMKRRESIFRGLIRPIRISNILGQPQVTFPQILK